MTISREEFVRVIYTSVKAAATSLLKNGEHFYYFSLVTSGEAHPPTLSAWSWDALERTAATDPNPEAARLDLKWSYADSPYFGYGEKEFFAPVIAAFADRPVMRYDWPPGMWRTEYEYRLAAMEEAVRRADADGVFGTGPERDKIAVLVEVMPPDSTNADRARRLNPPTAIARWLEEAAEE